MDAEQLLAAYDAQLRAGAEVPRAISVTRDGPLLRAVFGRGGFVTYADLAGLEGDDLAALVGRTVAYFRDETAVPVFEWKTRGHDRAPGLAGLLAAHGLEAQEQESVMLGEAAGLAGEVALADGVVVRRAGHDVDGHPVSRLVWDLGNMLEMQEQVFGAGLTPRLDDVLATLAASGDDEQYWLAEQGRTVVAAARLSIVPGTGFAGLWGGATRPEWRGRGIYRAVVAARARAAIARGVRYLHSDCSPMSRPILERSGLVAVTTTTPYLWHR